MPASQVGLFRSGVIEPFEKKHHVRVSLENFADGESLISSLRQAPDSLQPDILEAPYEMTLYLAKSGLLRDMESRVDPSALQRLRRDLFFSDLGSIEGKSWFLPHHVETSLWVYLKSRTAQASRFWDLRKEEIVRAMPESKNLRLPPDYVLENDPGKWDQLDLFVAGLFWKQQEAKGRRQARISMGLGSGYEAGLALMDAALIAGARPGELLRMDDPELWSALKLQGQICGERILRNGSFRGETFEDLGPAFKSGEIYAAQLTPRQAFMTHGNGTPQLPGYLRDPDDMGVTLWPQSLPTGKGAAKPFGEGNRRMATRIWFWGLGRGQGDAGLTGELLDHLSSTSSLVFEASNFGVIPARRDVLTELPLIFGGGWAGEVYQAAARQLIENGLGFLPRTEAFPEVAKVWSDAARMVCPDPRTPIARGGVEWDQTVKTLSERLSPKLRESLLADYPDPTLSASELEILRP